MPDVPSELNDSLLQPVLSYTDGVVQLELAAAIYQQVEQLYGSLGRLVEAVCQLNQRLESAPEQFNINPYSKTAEKGIYLLGLEESVFQLFPGNQLVLKGSRGYWGAEDPHKQFQRSLQLQTEFALKLTAEEQQFLGICPVYLYVRNRQQFLQHMLFMQRIEGPTLGQTPTGFHPKFCRVFDIPSLEEIAELPQFRLHCWLDGGQPRQLLKIQAAYLFERLRQKGITILSLNQKNIIETAQSEAGRYVIIDPIADYFPPISPAYNLLTRWFCG